MKTKLYELIAQTLVARENCTQERQREWKERHKDRIQKLVSSHLPSGSGFDNGTQFDFDASTPDKLVFHTGYHHMNENGCYDGWTDHSVIVRPSLAFGIHLRVTGRDRNETKDYVAEVFQQDLTQEIDEQTDRRVA